MNYLENIKLLIEKDIVLKKKHRLIETNSTLSTYFEIGKLLSESGTIYGEDIIGKYSVKLMVEVGKKYNKRTLFRMKQFYVMFNKEKMSPMVTQLTWTHYVILLSLNNYDEIYYYINEISNRNLSKRQLEYVIKNREYQILSQHARNKLISEKMINDVKDFIKNPVIIRNKYNYENVSEKLLQQLILEDIPSFLKELGKGFSFIENEYKIKLDDRYNYIDLLLYNIEFNCYVVIELKTTELRKEYIGQIEVYMNYIDKNVKGINQDKTIGIIICKKDNKFIMEYCSDPRIYRITYELVY